MVRILKSPGWSAGAVLAAVLLTTAAHAEAPAPARLDLSPSRAALSRAVFAPASERQSRVPRTAVERRFADDGVVDSIGYLCGLHSFPPGSKADGGPASAFGHQGTFLGAKVGFAFR